MVSFSEILCFARNKDIENNITIDLHAQHVREAIQVLKLHLQTLSSVPCKFYVIFFGAQFVVTAMLDVLLHVCNIVQVS